MSQQSDINLYTTQTPNGIKISITLEELGLPYTVHKIDISKNTQKEEWFLEINPNGRIPALTDTFTDGQTINLFESGSIMEYLVDRYDTDHKISFPNGHTRMTILRDIAHYGWVSSAGWAGVDIDEFPSLKAWEERMTSRSGVEKGRHVPDPHSIKELLQDKDKMEKYAAESRKWIQGGMKQDAEKQK
ncbi:unnamed protein product [Alternaria alternata]